MTLNKVMLIGNVGKDPEVRYMENGVVMARFSLATTERYKDNNGELKDITEWHSIICWRSLAEFTEKYIRKGAQIYIEGKIRNNSWEDQQGKHNRTEIVADSIRLLGKKSDTPSAGQQDSSTPRQQINGGYTTPPLNSQNTANTSTDDDDLPF